MEIIILHSTSSLPPVLRFHEALSCGYITSFKFFQSYIIINRLFAPLCPKDIHKFAKKVTVFRMGSYVFPPLSWNSSPDPLTDASNTGSIKDKQQMVIR